MHVLLPSWEITSTFWSNTETAEPDSSTSCCSSTCYIYVFLTTKHDGRMLNWHSRASLDGTEYALLTELIKKHRAVSFASIWADKLCVFDTCHDHLILSKLFRIYFYVLDVNIRIGVDMLALFWEYTFGTRHKKSYLVCDICLICSNQCICDFIYKPYRLNQ